MHCIGNVNHSAEKATPEACTVSAQQEKVSNKSLTGKTAHKKILPI
jgi:hypothetical protein